MNREKNNRCGRGGLSSVPAAVPVLLLLVVGGFFPSAVSGDTIHLKNGRVIDGQVRYQTMEYMLVRTEHRLHRIKKRSIRKIVYGVSSYERVQRVKAARKQEKALAKLVGAATEPKGPSRAELLRRRRARLRKIRRERERRERELRKKRLAEAREEARRKRIRRLRKHKKDLVQERRELISGDVRIRKTFAAEKERARKQDDEITTFRGALTRSLILPGLGQYYRGQKWKGGAFMGVFALLAWNYNQTRSDYNSIRATSAADLIVPLVALQDRAILVNAAYSSTRASEISNAKTPNQQALYLLVGFWAYNVFDLVYFEPKKPERTGVAYYDLLLAPDFARPVGRAPGPGTPVSKRNGAAGMGSSLGFQMRFRF